VASHETLLVLATTLLNVNHNYNSNKNSDDDNVMYIMNTFIRHKAVKNRQYVKTDRQTETDRR